jgi:hypothetical protein
MNFKVRKKEECPSISTFVLGAFFMEKVKIRYGKTCYVSGKLNLPLYGST